jgi:hypothetical protein
MPILGIMASAVSGNLTPTTGFCSIATTTVTSGAPATITFSSIPQIYKHLQIRLSARGTAGNAYDVFMRFNSDSGTNYSRHFIYGDNTVNVGSTVSGTYIHIAQIPYNTTLANTYGGAITDILDYTNTNKNKPVRSLEGKNMNGAATPTVGLFSGTWYNTAAVTSITLSLPGDGFENYTSAALYGIEG